MKNTRPRCRRRRMLVAASMTMLLLVPTVFSAVAPPPAATSKSPPRNVPIPSVKPTTEHILPPSTLTTVTTTTIATTLDFQLPTSTPTPPAVNIPSDSPLARIAACPPPLVPNAMNLVSATCMGACCLPCPASSVFYEPNKLEDIYTLTSIFRAVSATCCLVLALCYAILPSRRKHPHLIVLVFAMIMIPWEGLGTAWLHMRTDLLCKNVYEPTTMTNSWFCGVQGIALMYMVLAMLCLGFLLIANLHVLTVYRSYIVQNHLTKLMVLSFFLPLSLVLPVAIRKQIENPGFGSICFISSQVASPFFFYPLSVVVCLATLLHLGTIAVMIKTSIQNNSAAVSDSTSLKSQSDSQSNKTTSQRQRRLQTARDISQLLKQQWRPGLLALCLLIVDMIYWLFYFIEAKKLENVKLDTPWFNDWVTCLGGQAMEALTSGRLSATSTMDDVKAAGDVAQGACAKIAVSYVPSFMWAALADIMPAVFGIIVLIIFGTKLELWQDIRTRIFGKRDSTSFVMGDIVTKEEDTIGRHRRPLSPEEQQYQNYHSHSTKGGRPSKDIHDFYSDDLILGTANEFNSRDMIVMATQDKETPRYGGKQSRSRSESHAAPPATPFSEATYGGATRKISVTIQDDREPLSPQQELFQKHLFHEQHAKLVTEGAVPWPSWPSSTSTTISSTPTSPTPATFPSGAGGTGSPSFDRYVSSSPPPIRDLTIDTKRDHRDPIVSYPPRPLPPPRVTFPTLPISPQQKGFYNSEDISAPPIPLSQHSKIDRQLTTPYNPLPPPVTVDTVAVPSPSSKPYCSQAVQSVNIPARSSSSSRDPPPPSPTAASFVPLPPPPATAMATTSNAYSTQPVQSVVVPARGSSRDQGRVSSERPSRTSSERPPRVSNERPPHVSSERPPRVSSERQPRQWQQQQQQGAMDDDGSIFATFPTRALSPPPPPVPRKSHRRRPSNPYQE